MKTAEEQLPEWLATLYNYRISNLTEEMKIADNTILELYHRFRNSNPIQILTSLVSEIDTFQNNQIFKESIRAHALNTNASLTKARVHSHWDMGTRLAFDGMIALYLLIISAIHFTKTLSGNKKNYSGNS